VKLLRKLLILSHRYLGIALCLLVAMWFASGIVMMYAGGMPRLDPDLRLARMPDLDLSKVRLTLADASNFASKRSLSSSRRDTTLIAVIELSLSSWLVAGIVPGVERQPLKKLKTDENALLALLNRWRDEAVRSGHKIWRIRCSRDTATLDAWITCASMPRALSQRASQKPSRRASKATAHRALGACLPLGSLRR
jgi:hypothetical protein